MALAHPLTHPALTAPAPPVTLRARAVRRVRRLAPPVALIAVLAMTAAACRPPGATGNYTGDVVASMNQDRAAAGLAPLAWDGQLGPLAQSTAARIAGAGALLHTDLGAVIHLPYMAGWRTLGENLSWNSGVPSAGAVEDQWMASAAHRANILSGGFNRVGVGTAQDANGRLWVVAEFGAR
jgi:uncharacterized protein YkwD